MKMPKELSLWRTSYSENNVYAPLEGELEVDTVVVGAGITGLSTAYMLKQSGQTVAVLEKRSVGSGTTGRTTGKVSSLHELAYADLYNRLGKKPAKAYAGANQSAVELVRDIIKKERIDCDWHDDDNYTYTTNPEQASKLLDEANVAASLGLPASFEKTTDLPFEIAGAVRFTGQGKMNAQLYLLGLAKKVHGNGSYVFENSEAIGIRDSSDRCRVKTKNGVVYSKDIVVATSVPTLPLVARGAYCMLEYPTESFIVAGRPTKALKGMYISPDSNNYSILPIKTNGKDMLLVGGESNISGVRLGKTAKFQKLAAYAQKHFAINEIDYVWSDRDYIAYDKLPLIGLAYPWSKHLYTASAFRKWGLTNCTVAATVLHDLILNQENPWAETFTTQRLRPILSIPRVAAKYITRQN